ncbi:MAG TPA: hypothetical protein VIR98_01490 [Candidatus Paceibacterota bacterium]
MKKISFQSLLIVITGRSLREIFFLFCAVSFSLITPNLALAAEQYRVEPGTPETIDEHGVCYLVTNHAPNLPILVPTKTSNEWSGFYDNVPSGVDLDDCVPSEEGYEGEYETSYESTYAPGESTYTPTEASYPTTEPAYPPTEEGYPSGESAYPPAETTYEAEYESGYEPTYESEYESTYETTYESSYESDYEGECDPLNGPGSYHCECEEECGPYDEPNTDPDALCECGGATCELTCD